MADGKEEREERKARLEEQRKSNGKTTRDNDSFDQEPADDGRPERGGS
jgi:hypothetical protein